MNPLAQLTEVAEAEQFYEDLQDLLELTPKKDVLFTQGSILAFPLLLSPLPLQHFHPFSLHPTEIGRAHV